MRIHRSFSVALLLVSPLFLPSGAGASTQPRAVIALHAAPQVSKVIEICPGLSTSEDPNTLGIPCAEFTVDRVPTNQVRYVYLVAAQGDLTPGIAGLSCGIEVTGNVGVFGWTLCADQDLPGAGWPDPGTGNRITWDGSTNCQRTVIAPDPLSDGVQAVAGAIYVYAYDSGSLEIVPNPETDPAELEVIDCAGTGSPVLLGGVPKVGFGTEPGHNPCGSVIADCGCPGGLIGEISCCCLPDGSTEVCMDRAECEAAGGVYSVHNCDIAIGSGGCQQLTSCAPVPVLPSSWSRIKSRHEGP